MNEDWGIIILAAGSSTRLGTPKQLLMYKGKSLLQGSINTAWASGAKHVVLVLGANANKIEESLEPGPTKVVKNEGWQEGMASSIRKGLSELLKINKAISAVTFMVCDQPFVTPDLLIKLQNKYLQTGNPIITSGYGNSAGIPTLFGRSMFRELLTLTGDGGAKKIINEKIGMVSVEEFKEGGIDIDTESDYEKLLSGYQEDEKEETV